MRFRFIAFKDCEVCDGDGFITHGMKAGFNVKNMEITAEDDGEKCPNCMERSQDEYEYACESKAERDREEK